MKQFFLFRRIVLIFFTLIMVMGVCVFGFCVTDQAEALLNGWSHTPVMEMRADFPILVLFAITTVGAIVGLYSYAEQACLSYDQWLYTKAERTKLAQLHEEGTGHD